MKRLLSGYIFVSFFLMQCTKKNISPATQVIQPPLQGTIDKTDTLTVMAYNILNYGDGCQGTTTTLNNYLDTIVQFVQPDLLGCEKMNSFLWGTNTSTDFVFAIYS